VPHGGEVFPQVGHPRSVGICRKQVPLVDTKCRGGSCRRCIDRVAVYRLVSAARGPANASAGPLAVREAVGSNSVNTSATTSAPASSWSTVGPALGQMPDGGWVTSCRKTSPPCGTSPSLQSPGRRGKTSSPAQPRPDALQAVARRVSTQELNRLSGPP